MKLSRKIARIAGVELRVHLTFLVLIAWLAGSYWITGKSPHRMIAGVGVILAMFACVLLHEFGGRPRPAWHASWDGRRLFRAFMTR